MEYIACCGLVCGECPVYIATMNHDEGAKARLATEYSNEHCVFEKDDMNCEGCFSVGDNNNKMCGSCAGRRCGAEKILEKTARNAPNIPAT